jgi:hypothetical protein
MRRKLDSSLRGRLGNRGHYRCSDCEQGMSQVIQTGAFIIVALAAVTAIICLITATINPDGTTRSEPEDRDDHVGQGKT